MVNGLNNSDSLNLPKEIISKAVEQLGRGAGVRGEALTLEEFARLSNDMAEYMK